MRYLSEVEIDLPRERVIELFDSSENLLKWQPGLVKFEHLSGEPGQPGARSRMVFQHGKREIELIETITKRNLPQEFSGIYEGKGVWNEVRNVFEEESSGKTLWQTESHFKFRGFMKLLGLLLPGCFRKETINFMTAFKDFAEKQGAGSKVA